MKKWERPKLVDLSLINTEQVCTASVSGWFICGNNHCFELKNHDDKIICPKCGDTNISTYCGPTPS